MQQTSGRRHEDHHAPLRVDVSECSDGCHMPMTHAMQKLSNDIGIDLGSGYPSDPKTRSSINELISGENPHDCLRWTWSTVRRAWEEMHGTSVPIRYENKHIYSQTNIEHWIEGNHK